MYTYRNPPANSRHFLKHKSLSVLQLVRILLVPNTWKKSLEIARILSTVVYTLKERIEIVFNNSANNESSRTTAAVFNGRHIEEMFYTLAYWIIQSHWVWSRFKTQWYQGSRRGGWEAIDQLITVVNYQRNEFGKAIFNEELLDFQQDGAPSHYASMFEIVSTTDFFRG